MNRLLVSLILGVTMAMTNSATAQQQFDGRWSIEAAPEKGACTRAHRYAVVIDNGVIRNRGRERVSVSGGLEANGSIRGNIRSSRSRVNVTGKLSERSGSGDWSITGRMNCSGRWTAEKRS